MQLYTSSRKPYRTLGFSHQGWNHWVTLRPSESPFAWTPPLAPPSPAGPSTNYYVQTCAPTLSSSVIGQISPSLLLPLHPHTFKKFQAKKTKILIFSSCGFGKIDNQYRNPFIQYCPFI